MPSFTTSNVAVGCFTASLMPRPIIFDLARGGILEGRHPSRLEHFQEKWNPVFRPKMRQRKNARAVSVSSNCETAPALLHCFLDLVRPNGERLLYGDESQPHLRERNRLRL